MARTGWNGNAALQEAASALPAKARPIIEVLDVVSQDSKSTRDDWLNADVPTFNGFNIVAGDGLALALGTAGDFITTLGEAQGGAGISPDNRPAASTPDTVFVEWSNADALKEFNQITARVDQQGTGGNNPVTWTAQVFRLASMNAAGIEPVYNLQSLTAPITVDAPPTGLQDIIFTLSTPVSPGAPFEVLAGDPSTFGITAGKTYSVLFVWGTRSNGNPATSSVWETTDQGGTYATGLNFASRRNLITESAEQRYSGGAGPAPNIPYFAISGADYVAATIEFTGIGPSGPNRLDLGTGFPEPSGTTLRLTVLKSEVSDSSVVQEIREPGGTWFAFENGDIIGEGGLAAVPRRQDYDVRATLTPSGDNAFTPILYNMTLTEQRATLALDEIQVDSFEQMCDPLLCRAEISTAAITLRTDGIKDYRSYAEELFSANPFAELLIRLYIGHEDLPRSAWLDVDTFRVRQYDASGDGISTDLIGTTSAYLSDFPPVNLRLPAPSTSIYDFAAVNAREAWLEIVTGVALDGVLGASPPGVPNPTIDAVRLTDTERTVELREELDLILGGVTVTSQGQFDFRPLFDGQPVDPSLEIAFEDYEVIGWDNGTGSAFGAVQIEGRAANGDRKFYEYEAPSEVLDAYGRSGTAVATQVLTQLNRWIPPTDNVDSEIPDTVGQRFIDIFSAGVQRARIRCATVRPHAEVGDVLSFEQDTLLEYDPFSGGARRGRGFVRAIIVGVHDVWGRELTLWIPPTFTTVAQKVTVAGPLGARRTVVRNYPGSAFVPSRWVEDYATLTGSGNIQRQRMSWESWDGRLSCEAERDNQNPRAVLGVGVIEGAVIEEAALSVDIPSGTVNADMLLHPSGGGPSVVLASWAFVNTVGPVSTVQPVAYTLQAGDRVSVDVDCPDLDTGETFAVYGFGVKTLEV